LLTLSLRELQRLIDPDAEQPAAPLWTPLPGPQTDAYNSLADELFYGGAAGGGKSWLVLGLALTAHRRSIIFRREHTQLRQLIDDSRKLLTGRGARYNGQDHVWRGIPGARILEFGGVPHETNVERYQGRAHDFKAFDEIPTFAERQFRFLKGWMRTDMPGQRTRTVCTGNPPTDPEGEWVVKYWAPWLDADHPDYPEIPGKLRWFAVIGESDVEVESGSPFMHDGEEIQPQSRTFIPARIEDNPIYMQTGYKSVLQSLPEPLRSKFLFGDFSAAANDNPWQVIPTEWIRAAQRRWDGMEKPELELRCLSADVARGGDDSTVIARMFGNWIAPLEKFPGKDTPDGIAVADLIGSRLSGDAVAFIDVIAVGTSPYDILRMRKKRVYGVNFSTASTVKDKTRTLEFSNLRAEVYWRAREMLDPASEWQIALPPDRELLVDLAAPRYSADGRKVKIELKDEIKKRIGRSPDKGDAVVMLLWGAYMGAGRSVKMV